MPDKKVLNKPVRFTVDIEAEDQSRLQAIADYYHEGNRQEVIRQAIRDLIVKHIDLVVYKCPRCGWSLKSDGGDPVKRLVKDHERTCSKKEAK